MRLPPPPPPPKSWALCPAKQHPVFFGIADMGMRLSHLTHVSHEKIHGNCRCKNLVLRRCDRSLSKILRFCNNCLSVAWGGASWQSTVIAHFITGTYYRIYTRGKGCDGHMMGTVHRSLWFPRTKGSHS